MVPKSWVKMFLDNSISDFINNFVKQNILCEDEEQGSDSYSSAYDSTSSISSIGIFDTLKL